MTKLSDFGIFDTVQLTSVPNVGYTPPPKTYPVGVHGMVYEVTDVAIFIAWPTKSRCCIERNNIHLVKLVSSWDNSDNLLRVLKNVGSITRYEVFYDGRSSGELTKNGRLPIYEKQFLISTCGACFATVFNNLNNSTTKKENKDQQYPNRILFDQNIYRKGENSRGLHRPAMADLKHFWAMGKKWGLIQEHVSFSNFRLKRMLINLDKVENSLKLYVLINMLRLYKESPYSVTLACELDRRYDICWVDCVLLAILLSKRKNYHSLFDLALDTSLYSSTPPPANLDEVLIGLAHFGTVRHLFSSNNYNRSMEGIDSNSKEKALRAYRLSYQRGTFSNYSYRAYVKENCHGYIRELQNLRADKSANVRLNNAQGYPILQFCNATFGNLITYLQNNKLEEPS